MRIQSHYVACCYYWVYLDKHLSKYQTNLTCLVTASVWSLFFPCCPQILFLNFLSFPFSLAAAANQRETLKSPFHLKEEPKVEEALSPRPSSQSHSQVQPSFPATFCQDGPVGAVAATERHGPLKPREGSPMAKNSLLSQDINVKVASELLMKLSGRVCMHCVFGSVHVCNKGKI